MAFEIKTTKSDYPFLVLADGIIEAIEIAQREKKMYDGNIISVQQLDAYNTGHILVKDLILAEERLEEKVHRELEAKMPRWKKRPNGAAGGDNFPPCFLVRSSKGHYFTSSTIGGDGYYLDMDSLEQLPGIAKDEKEDK